tara:strand:+ start:11824 stop:12102 length:279 start_codon:yes stop_codon:yes gene_type:complete
MSIYNNQKIRFSHTQSNYHKLLNILREDQNLTLEQNHALIKINEHLERIDYHIQEYTEQKETDPEEMQNIRLNNIVINTFKPLMLGLRFFMD